MQSNEQQIALIDYELEIIRDTRVMLMKLLGKKGKSDEHRTILQETLKHNREREQELLNERREKEASTSNGGDTRPTGVTKDNAN